MAAAARAWQLKRLEDNRREPRRAGPRSAAPCFHPRGDDEDDEEEEGRTRTKPYQRPQSGRGQDAGTSSADGSRSCCHCFAATDRRSVAAQLQQVHQAGFVSLSGLGVAPNSRGNLLTASWYGSTSTLRHTAELEHTQCFSRNASTRWRYQGHPARHPRLPDASGTQRTTSAAKVSAAMILLQLPRCLRPWCVCATARWHARALSNRRDLPASR